MKERITPFLKQQMLHSKAIALQYEALKSSSTMDYNDPLMEDQHEVVKGLIHKYKNRVLIKVSYFCAAHCQFCTRIRQIGQPEGLLTEADIEAIVIYITSHTEIDEVIFSGGDPFFTPHLTFKLLQRLQEISHLKVFRIGTRLPFHSPEAFQSQGIQKLLDLINVVGQTRPFFILVHIEHPDELCDATREVIHQLRRYPVTLLSQTVFLKGINDDFETLHFLFQSLYHLGVQPYYLYRCDNVKGLEHFQGDIEHEKQIAQRLRLTLSGIACPLFVEDLENGYAKQPIV